MKNLFRIGFGLVVVFLFIGVNLSPSICGNIQNSGPLRNVFNEINGTIENKNVCDELESIGDMNAQLFDVYDIIDFGQTAYGLTSADFNGDGPIDFAVSSATCPFTHSTISIFYNNGDLEFTKDDVFTFSYSYIESLDSGDYDNDGNIDLIFSYSPYIYYQGMYVKVYGVVSMLFNDGENHFGNSTMIAKRGSGIPYDPEERCNPKVTSADYDMDGDIDLLVGDNSGKVEFYLNNGTGNFTSSGVINDWGLCSWGLTSADYDNDGDIDFLVAAALNSNWGYVYLKRNQMIESNATTIFESGPGEIVTDIYNLPGTESLTSLDYEKNGEMDFIAGNFFELFLYLNKQGIYDSFKICRIPFNTEGQPEDLTFGGLTSADFDNDGYDDFVAGGVQGVVRLFINNHGLAAITRPHPSRLYIFNKEYESPIAEDKIVIIGKITIDVKGLKELQKVEFYIGDILRKIDTTYPYNWTWRVGGSLLQKRTIRVVAYNTTGNSSVTEIKVWKFF
jgi:hypothetical protein